MINQIERHRGVNVDFLAFAGALLLEKGQAAADLVSNHQLHIFGFSAPSPN
ncbi:hypothetical protein ACVDG8_037675 (plasmid) [Mesorhizobium sp. ORM8.1]